eukprot:gnl/TRDRNA2_/TRDRNA2_203967_c0_seq1.p1 gnl/TRDRNA2_/TRDRNA2_203967_c0~~gnl/TRDRNA2_/TRDRNA2_203967_c0_seq1.p1  ORF type:complete len:454 (-),score=49.77 gnl/TRDRNA2_/TRDRNA2_203967_c0_seq1:169-1530(-)
MMMVLCSQVVPAYTWQLALFSFGIFLPQATAAAVADSDASFERTSRRPVVSLPDFGGVGDGQHLNTDAFEDAVASLKASGGGTLVVPRGIWLTAPFNVTSNMTLYLDRGSTLLATNNVSLWPVLGALPTYGQGRDHPSPFRRMSFIFGYHVQNFVLTGDGGVVDGQGQKWWSMSYAEERNITRGSLIEVLYGQGFEISHVVLRNSPFWTVHPYFTDYVHIHDVDIWAPGDSRNTDGVDPDSSQHVLIENMRYHGGDDAIAIKSGWDCFGNGNLARPTRDVLIRNVTVVYSPSAGLAIGSEMSGGIDDITVQDCNFSGSNRGGVIYIKTSPTRGGYVRNVHFRNVTVSGASMGLGILQSYGDPNPSCPAHVSIPSPITNISFRHVFQSAGTKFERAAVFEGRDSSPISNLSLFDVHLKAKEGIQCKHVLNGRAVHVTPTPCAELGPGVLQELLV